MECSPSLQFTQGLMRYGDKYLTLPFYFLFLAFNSRFIIHFGGDFDLEAFYRFSRPLTSKLVTPSKFICPSPSRSPRHLS